MSANIETRFRAIVDELVDENPLAIRPVLKILVVVFTRTIPTLAVSCELRPRLLVNPDFVERHCTEDAHVKAVLLHEFLHVVLRHTEERKPFTPARHLAFDAVINAIIHRQYGADYSSMMSRYYAKARGLYRLLRPMTEAEVTTLRQRWINRQPIPAWHQAWEGLYEGSLVADDIEALVETCAPRLAGNGSGTVRAAALPGGESLLGDHDTLNAHLPDNLAEAIESALRQMNGHGIWRAPKWRGIGENPYEALFAAVDQPMARWRARTLEVLRRHLLPDRRAPSRESRATDVLLPVLNPRDRRSAIRAMWSPLIPDSLWQTGKPQPGGTAQVYLDASGSMYAELPAVIALLGSLARHIRKPLFAFSTHVAPAVIENGLLKAETTGGTSMACVLDHIAKTRPAAAVVVTDGYIEAIEPQLLAAVGRTRLHVILTRDGSTLALKHARIPCTQLERFPQ